MSSKRGTLIKLGVFYREGQIVKCNPIFEDRLRKDGSDFARTNQESQIEAYDSNFYGDRNECDVKIKDYNWNRMITLLAKGVEYDEN